MKFFVAAYMVIWLFLMGYTFYLGQRQRKLHRGIEFLRNLLNRNGG